MRNAAEEFVENKFDDVVGASVPDVYWDAASRREGGMDCYRFLLASSGKSVMKTFSAIPGFLGELPSGSLLAIAVPSNMCNTKLFSWFKNGEKTEEDAVKGAIPYRLDACDFASVGISSGSDGYSTGIVSSFPNFTRDALQRALALFLENEGSVVHVVDRVFFLTRFAATVCPPECGETLLGAEKRGDSFFIWSMTNENGVVTPVNSSYIRIPEMNPDVETRRQCVFLNNELIRIHKRKSPTKLVYIDAGGESTVEFPRPVAMEAVKSAIPSISSHEMVTADDAVFTGMLSAFSVSSVEKESRKGIRV